MNRDNKSFCFQQIHIDVARNATDDFNLFHDPHKWHRIKSNPFGGPIVLGFQLVALVENWLRQPDILDHDSRCADTERLRFSNYQFTFVKAVKPGETVSIESKKPQLSDSDGKTQLSHRIAMKTNGKLALMGYKRDSEVALFLADGMLSGLDNLKKFPDRSYLENGFFLKRKYMNTSNAKNFLCGCFTDQSLFFDELGDKANFPEIFPCSLISCALLEKALNNGHDFEENPMVYTSHRISVDRLVLSQLKSNDALSILVRELPEKTETYECYGLIHDNRILFRAMIGLTALRNILKSK